MSLRDYFHNRLDQLGERKRVIDAPVDIKYTRGATSFDIVEVTIGKTMVDEVYPGLDTLIRETRDYIFDFADFPSEFGLPIASDVISELPDGISCLAVPLDNNSCYKWTTATRKRIRIHTQIIKQVLAGS